MARLRWIGRRAFIHQRCCAESSLHKCSLRGIPLLRLRDAPTNGKCGGRKKINQKQLIIPKSVNSKYPWVKGKKKNDGKGGQLKGEQAASLGVQICCNNKSKSEFPVFGAFRDAVVFQCNVRTHSQAAAPQSDNCLSFQLILQVTGRSFITRRRFEMGRARDSEKKNLY